MATSPQLPLADDLFLTAHDSVKGKCQLSPATLGLGMAAALIGELVLWRRLDLVDGKIQIIDDRPTGDPAATAVLDQLLREGHHRAIRDWISFLATGIAVDLVERRLSRAGLVQRQEKRGLFGSKVSFVPSDSMIAGWPATRIRTFIGRGEMLDVPDLVLAGLILATGLDQHVFVTLDARGRSQLFDQLKRRLPAMLHELVSQTEAAVGDAVMARRA
ncbi:GOLPH3/VPS74 family protein [Paractinoplanes atraurantiacus]|uniref:Golgi phosphoprotein 3 (GPP34) n=1 Tax=Paractinoplanes atraurantiacus TaxID=1036182 RepID=A0A285IM60_9ACTN|nr:GPP34 family phosphoprotein [Actinoplanes atraurantiacus]SNY48963.1 Golgi phosphoprotein 3 (GPP34) [Actinoplanes atraurantiacus]